MNELEHMPRERQLPGRVTAAIMSEVRTADGPSAALSGWRAALRSRRGLAAALAAVVLVGGGSAAAYGVLRGEAVPVEGAFNPGQPLHCTGIELLQPEQVQQALQTRGYEVVWQYETAGGPLPTMPPTGSVIVDVAILGTQAIVVAEDFDAADPLHQRRRAGQPQVPCGE